MRAVLVLSAVCTLSAADLSWAGATADDSPLAERATQALKSAVAFYRTKVAYRGGYVYYYSVDLQRRLGEGVASPTQIWVQPPGTPTVGMAYLQAYDATGDAACLDAATEAADALIYGQLVSGAWTNSIDFDPRSKAAGRYRNGQGRGRNTSSLDDDQTQSAIRFLIHADKAHGFKNAAIHDSVMVALDALLNAQYANGAFPQVWDEPLDRNQPVIAANFPRYDWRTEGRIKNYWDMYTLNDGLAGTVASVLIDAHDTYRDPRYLEALQRFGDFLRLAQLPEPQPAWAQQYDYAMHPIWARKFEPPAVSGRESEDVIDTLMTICEQTSDAKYLEPIPRAIAYLKRSRLPDGRLARYYELQTNRPLYMSRRGDTYSLTYSDADLPSHYGWKNPARIDELEARLRSIKQGKPLRQTGSLAERVRAIVDSLDDQGRWITTYQGELLVGQPKFRPGDRYISSQVFYDNIDALSRYLAQAKMP